MLKAIYTLFLGLLLSTFVGVGISTFYVTPEPPEYDISLTRATLGDEDIASLKAQDKVQQEYQDKMSVYNRNVSIVALVFALAILLISLGLNKKLGVLSDGVLLGGVFTLLYSIMRGLSSDESIFRFILVTIGLVLVLILGYWKFIRPETKKA